MSTETAEPDDESNEVVPVQSGGILTPARYGFDPGQVKAIKQTVAKDCTDAELVMFLEVCARYQLDPFAKQAYAAKMNGQSGGVSIIVSRDGLLAHAHRQQDFVNMDGDVVCANDEFGMEFAEGQRQVHHKYDSSKDRGAVVGGWAMVERAEHGTTYFYAPMSEYRRSSSIWGKHPSAMILKVAESMALRKAYSISGVVGEAEMDTSRATNLTTVPSAGNDLHPDWGEDPELAAKLRDAVSEARGLWPENWLPAKVNAMLHGATDEQRTELLNEIQTEIDRHREQEEVVVDAEVVEDDAPEAA